MDMTFHTMPIFLGESMRVYREAKFDYNISDAKHPNNHLIYVVKQELACYILYVNNQFHFPNALDKVVNILKLLINDVWNLYFYVTTSREG